MSGTTPAADRDAAARPVPMRALLSAGPAAAAVSTPPDPRDHRPRAAGDEADAQRPPAYPDPAAA